MSDAVVGPVLIVGTGLIGTSVALALVRAGVTVWLEDAEPAHVAEAVERGAGIERPDGGQPALVVVAVPPTLTAGVMADAVALFPESVITDVASVKSGPLAEVELLAGRTGRVVGGHPMAGREVSGPGAARADLFDDRVWVVAAPADAKPESVALVRDLARTCGGVVIEMAPADHDRAVALTSHVPQVLSSALAARIATADPSYVGVSGQGLRDATRIAGSDPGLWSDILRANALPVADVLADVAADLQSLVTALRVLASGGATGAARADEVVGSLLTRGNEGKALVPGKHGGQGAVDMAQVMVVVADEPGSLAALFKTAGDAGINLEDVRIEHVLGRPSGRVELNVRPADSDRLVQILREQGLDVRV